MPKLHLPDSIILATDEAATGPTDTFPAITNIPRGQSDESPTELTNDAPSLAAPIPAAIESTQEEVSADEVVDPILPTNNATILANDEIHPTAGTTNESVDPVPNHATTDGELRGEMYEASTDEKRSDPSLG